VTKDWKSWAYAWLLLLMAIGIGLLMVNRDTYKNTLLRLIGWGLTISGITFFAIFGAIAGGLFIQVIAPLLIVGVGLAAIKVKPELILLKKSSQSGTKVGGNQRLEQYQIEPLSSRELEVLHCIQDGLSNQQIALKLSVAPSTVKTHINNIYGKLNVENRVQALNRANQLGLLDS
jgi:DNA-binding CsgD family transcriptional regulator